MFQGLVSTLPLVPRTVISGKTSQSRGVLEGEVERDVIVLLFKKDQELVALASLQRFEDTLTLYGRLGHCAPISRREVGPSGACAAGVGGTGDGYGSHLRSCRICNSQHADGFREGGISDCRHRSCVRPTNGGAGVIKRVYEAIYVKVLAAAADVLRPQAESMTPRTRALYDFLFAG